MKVATKLALGLGLLVLVLVGTLAFHVSTLGGVLENNRELSAIAARFPVASGDLLPRVDELEEMARKYRATRDVRYAGRFAEALQGFETTLEGLLSASLSEEEREAAARLEDRWRAFRPMAEHLDAPAVEAPPLSRIETALDGLRDGVRRVNQASQTAMVAQVRASAAAARGAERFSWAAVAGALLLSVGVAVFIHRAITRPLRRLASGMHAVAEGDFEHRLHRHRDDEFAQLARDFNRMAQHLGELERAKSHFLSQVSHDLKTPLASMQEASGLLLEEIPGALNPRQRRLLELSRRSGMRLGSMISKLLDLSRMDSGSFQYEFHRVDLARLVGEAVEEFEARLAERSLRLETDLPPDPLHANCDGERIIEAFHNLLENALKFSPDGGRIRVRLRSLPVAPATAASEEAGAAGVGENGDRPPATGALIEVSDEGPGVPPEDRERIFERFQQLDGGRRSGGGVGLGLAVVREILRAHGGSAWVVDGPGERGSTFCLFVPQSRSARAAATSGPADREAPARPDRAAHPVAAAG